MRSSASSVPKLPQGMARMKNSRKPSEHGLRLFAPITCFVVKSELLQCLIGGQSFPDRRLVAVRHGARVRSHREPPVPLAAFPKECSRFLRVFEWQPRQSGIYCPTCALYCAAKLEAGAPNR